MDRMTDYKYQVMIDKVSIQNRYVNFVAGIKSPDLTSKICIQIPSFCDDELLRTIESYLKNAANPDRLTFAVCFQDDDLDVLAKLHEIPNCLVKHIPASESPGLCATRYFCNQMLQDEEFVLHTDSHMRAAKYWDVAMIFMWQQLHNKKAILSAYPLDYANYVEKDPTDEIFTQQIRDTGSFISIVANFDVEGTIRFKGYDRHREPETIRGMFISGGCVFASSDLDKDCPVDPNMFFVADEGTLDARYFTHGYDIYHPAYMPFWHWYGERSKKDGSAIKRFNSSNAQYKQLHIQEEHRIRSLFDVMKHPLNLKEFGFGSVRTFDEFLELSGIDFKHHACRSFAKTGHYFQAFDTLPEKEKEWNYHTGTSVHTCDALTLPVVSGEDKKTICVQMLCDNHNLLRAVLSLYYQAHNTNRIHFCICLPDSLSDLKTEIMNHGYLKHIKISFVFLPDDMFQREASVSNQLSQSVSDYVLFTDSNVMAIRNWDQMLIRQLEHISDEHPVISATPPDFGPTKGRALWRGSFDLPYESKSPEVLFSDSKDVKDLIHTDFQDALSAMYNNTHEFDAYIPSFHVCKSYMFSHGDLNEQIIFPEDSRRLPGLLAEQGYQIYAYRNCYLLQDEHM